MSDYMVRGCRPIDMAWGVSGTDNRLAMGVSKIYFRVNGFIVVECL